MEQWIDFTTTELDSPLLSWILPLLGHWPYDKKVLLRKARCNQHAVPGQSSSSAALFWRTQAEQTTCIACLPQLLDTVSGSRLATEQFLKGVS